MKNVVLSVVMLAQVFMFACASAAGEGEGEGEDVGEGEGEGEGEEGEGEGDNDDCTLVNVSSFVFDFQDDTDTSYSAPLLDNIGTPLGNDVLVLKIINQGDRVPAPTGTFPLATGINENFATCAECFLVFEDQEGLNGVPSRLYFHSAGSIRLDQDPRRLVLRGSVEGLVVREATIGENFVSTFVPGGACLRFNDISLDYKVIPEEWTCDDSQYRDDAVCDCDCGSEDPDCYAVDNAPVNGCAASEVCVQGTCSTPCDATSDTPTCTDGFCAPGAPTDYCTADTDLIDDADIGEACAPPPTDPFAFSPPYCGFDGAVVRGLCVYADFVNDTERTCQPLCAGRDDCNAANSEDCTAVFSTTFLPSDRYRGYCYNIVPEGWTCDPDLFVDDQVCNCDCGVTDYDCYQAELPITGCGDNETCTLDGRCVAVPLNDACADAALVTPGTYEVDSTFGSADLLIPAGAPGCNEDAGDGIEVFYKVDVSVGQTLRVTALGVNFYQPYVVLLEGSATTCTSEVTECLASSNAYGDPELRVVELEITPDNVGNGQIYVVVDDVFDGGLGGQFTLSVELTP
jgi:hypothetical protein